MMPLFLARLISDISDHRCRWDNRGFKQTFEEKTGNSSVPKRSCFAENSLGKARRSSQRAIYLIYCLRSV